MQGTYYSLALLILIIILQCSIVENHPLCSDATVPQYPTLSFCSMYNGNGSCCTNQDDALTQNEYNTYGLQVGSACANIMKQILCGKCDPWAVHIIGTENHEYNLNGVPILCPSYCEAVYTACATQTIPSSIFGVNRLADQYTSESFCAAFANNGSRGIGSYCYKGEPYEEPPTVPVSSTEDALCLEVVADVGANFITLTFMPPPDNRALYADQLGYIKLIKQRENSSAFDTLGNYLVISGVTETGEGGILGIAIHPNWRNNGRFFVSYTPSETSLIVAEYQANGDPLTSTSAVATEVRRLFTIQQSGVNHNGGQLLFGPDGYLYLFTGDGGGNAHLDSQDLSAPMGKIHRIDVNNGNPFSIPNDNPFVGNASVLQSVYAYGLRNPWRNSFDRVNGRLFIGDVGESEVEEVTVLAAPPSSGGANLGWRKFEGTRFNNYYMSDPLSSDAVIFPAFEYYHDIFPASACIIGGYVYRGSLDTCNYGRYIFADQKNQFLSATEVQPNQWTAKRIAFRCATDSVISCKDIASIESFAEDYSGNVYVLSRWLWKVVSPSRCVNLTCSQTPVQSSSAQNTVATSQSGSQQQSSESQQQSSATESQQQSSNESNSSTEQPTQESSSQSSQPVLTTGASEESSISKLTISSLLAFLIYCTFN